MEGFNHQHLGFGLQTQHFNNMAKDLIVLRLQQKRMAALSAVGDKWEGSC